jgi:hypothetical protein
MFRRCKHKWILRAANKEMNSNMRGPLRVTRLLYVCDLCSDPRTRVIHGDFTLSDFAVLTSHELEKMLKT